MYKDIRTNKNIFDNLTALFQALSTQCKCVEMFSQFFIMRIDYVDMIQSYFLISILNSIFCKVDIAVNIVKGQFEKKKKMVLPFYVFH